VLPWYEIWLLLWPTSSNHGTTKTMVCQVHVVFHFMVWGLGNASIHNDVLYMSRPFYVMLVHQYMQVEIYISSVDKNCSVGHLPTFDLGNNSLSNWSVCHMLKGLKHHICGVGMWKKRCRLKFQERLTFWINQKLLIINY
jgi:hypothetical protein